MVSYNTLKKLEASIEYTRVKVSDTTACCFTEFLCGVCHDIVHSRSYRETGKVCVITVLANHGVRTHHVCCVPSGWCHTYRSLGKKDAWGDRHCGSTHPQPLKELAAIHYNSEIALKTSAESNV